MKDKQPCVEFIRHMIRQFNTVVCKCHCRSVVSRCVLKDYLEHIIISNIHQIAYDCIEHAVCQCTLAGKYAQKHRDFSYHCLL